MKITQALIIFTLLCSLVAGLQSVEVATANFVGSIPPALPIFYIRSDGTIDPASAPISQSGDTYSLTKEIADYTIKIQKDNIIFDGNGHSIEASPVEPPMMIPIGWHPAIDVDKTNNITIRNVKLQGCYSAIYVEESTNITIISNNMVGNGYGIVMRESYNTTIVGNNITNGSTGIIFYSSSNNTIIENNISCNNQGIEFYSISHYNNILSNNLTANTKHAILFDGGTFHKIIGNNITNNAVGICNDFGYQNCTIYFNNFITNTENVQIDTGLDVELATWDNAKEGNFWSNYTGVDNNGDGMGDTPYIINAYNKDNFPLMLPFKIENSTILLPTATPSILPTPSPTLITPNISPISSPTQTPTTTSTVNPSPTIPEFSTWIILPILALTALTALVYAKRIKRETRERKINF